MKEHGCYDCIGMDCEGCDICHYMPTHWVQGKLDVDMMVVGINALGAAVVKDAAREYRHACRRYRRGDIYAKYLMQSLEGWFKSKDFDVFTKLDGEMLVDRIKKEEFSR